MAKIKAVPCPTSFLGEFHLAAYDLNRRVWKCRHCGVGGNKDGFEKLTKLEEELYRLKVELEISKFEAELAVRGWAA